MSNGSEKTDAAFLEYLRTRLSSGESGDSSPAHVVPSVRDVVTLGSLKKLQLQENDVAKVRRCSDLYFALWQNMARRQQHAPPHVQALALLTAYRTQRQP